jgi:endonuclease YncB( thermonuclease family)
MYRKASGNYVRTRSIAISALTMALVFAAASAPSPALADITCYDFDSQAEAQAVYDALPGDAFGIDTGWPLPSLASGDQEAGNGVACDATADIPELASPGNEEYQISTTSAENGLEALPNVDLEEATVREVQYQESVHTEENPSQHYRIMGIATPEYELSSDYEGIEVPGQCGAYGTTQRLQELLAPGTTIWLEVDDAGSYADPQLNEEGVYKATQLDRQVWVELNGRYRLVAEILVSEGHAVVATQRPGMARPDVRENPPLGSRYRDALRVAQELAIESGVGIWGQCVA